MLTMLFFVFFFSTLFPLIHLFNAISWKKKKTLDIKEFSGEEKGFSILIPCYNEEMILATTIDGLLNVDYQNHEVIFINDGSTDETFGVLNDLLDLEKFDYYDFFLENQPVKNVFKSRRYSNFYLIDKVNGGKADSLNAAIAMSKKDFVITLDADSILEKNSLKVANQHLQDPNIIAAGGMVHILQANPSANSLSPKLKFLNMIVKLQIFEYLKGFYIYKMSLSKFNALAIISGAFGIFKRDILVSVNGYRETLGEDIDITLKFQRYIYKSKEKKIVFIPDAICYTECPESWSDLYKQRIRWQKAFIDCVRRHFFFFLRTFLLRTLGFFFLVDAFLVGVIASYFTFFSFSIMFLLDYKDPKVLNSLSFYILGSLLCNILYNAITLFVSRQHGVRYRRSEIWPLFQTIFIDLTVYRFVTLFFVLWGTILYLFNQKGWNKVERTGRKYTLTEGPVKMEEQVSWTKK